MRAIFETGTNLSLIQCKKLTGSEIAFIFLFNDIDVRRRDTRKVHPLKAWIGPSIVK